MNNRYRELPASLVLEVIHFFLSNSIIAINLCFDFDTNTLSIAPLLQQPTIAQHVKLLETVIMNDMKSSQWHTLHINQGIVS